jgi:hypothetical protein
MLLDFDFIEWDEDDDPNGNVMHIASAGLTPDEVEDVLRSPNVNVSASRSSGRAAVFGWTGSNKHIIVICDMTSERGVTVLRPRTAYEIPPP